MAAASYPELMRVSMVLVTALAAASIAMLGLVVIHREVLRRTLLRAVDPRPLAMMRVGFGLCLLLGALEVAPLNAYLFADEGLLPSAAVGQVYGKAALAGYGDGVRAPAGFDGGASLLQFVTSGRWSLLYFWDSPEFVRGYFLMFVLACSAMIVGWRTRVSTAVTWLLYVGMLRRGDAHWGGEQVFCGFLFLLMLARAGEALSVDNWSRCRRLRGRGLLSEVGGPGDGAGAGPGPGHPQGLAAIYRRVPVWPQALIVAQLAICYAANGWAKSGSMWAAGDSLVYVLTVDRYARFDFQGLVLLVGEWPLRAATWGVLWWERLFPVLVVGLWISAARRSGAPALGRAGEIGARVCWVALAAALGLAAAVPEGLVANDGDALGGVRAGVFAAMAAAISLALVLAGRTVRVRGRVIDRAWFAAWPLGAWLWLGFGALFHAVNFLTLNVGMFALATLATYVVCVGDSATAALQRCTRWLARRGVKVPKHLARETAVAAEDGSLPHLWRDAASTPGWALAVSGGLVLVGAVAGSTWGIGWWHAAWMVAAGGLLVVGRRAARVDGEVAAREPWAYGPAGRTAAAGFVAYHLVALLIWQVPAWPSLWFRDAARKMVDPWLELTFTRQVWAMFSPNGPRTNLALRTVVIDAAGAEHDLRTELEHPENLVRPYVWHDRWRKIDEVVLGSRKWLATWHARYLCRRWELERGESPREVVLTRVSAPVVVGGVGDSSQLFWAKAKLEEVERVTCATEPFAQLDAEVRARHGLAPAREGSLHHSWPAKPDRPEPWTPLWWVMALGLCGGVVVWAREDRRRKVIAAKLRRTDTVDEA